MNRNIFTRSPAEVVKALTKRTLFAGFWMIGAAVISGRLEAVLGLIFGLSVALLLFRLKLTHSRRALEMDKEAARRFIRNRMIINYFIFFVVLAAAAWQPNLDLLAAALGLLLLKFTIIFSAVMEMIRSFIQEKRENFRISPPGTLRRHELEEEYLKESIADSEVGDSQQEGLPHKLKNL